MFNVDWLRMLILRVSTIRNEVVDWEKVETKLNLKIGKHTNGTNG